MYLYLHKHESIDKKPGTESSDDKSYRSDNMVKKILRDYLDKKDVMVSEEELNNLQILRDRKGKPHIQFPCREENGSKNRLPIHYSISHSGNWWGCIMADEPVGFDIEQHRDKVNHYKIAERYFTKMEKEYILRTGLDGFFKVWVRKEAYVKFLGSGLANVLNRFSVINDMELSPIVIPIIKEGEPGLPFCHINECFIENGIEAAYCSGSPIKEIIAL